MEVIEGGKKEPNGWASCGICGHSWRDFCNAGDDGLAEDDYVMHSDCPKEFLHPGEYDITFTDGDVPIVMGEIKRVPDVKLVD